MKTTKRRRRNFGTIIEENVPNGAPYKYRRIYGSWIASKENETWIARCGSSLSIRSETLAALLNRIDEAGKDI